MQLLAFSGRYTSGVLCVVSFDYGYHLVLSEISNTPREQDRKLGSLIAYVPFGG